MNDEYKNMACRTYINHIHELADLRNGVEIMQELASEFEPNNAVFLESLDARKEEYTNEIDHACSLAEKLAQEMGTPGDMLLDRINGKTYDAIARTMHYELSSVKRNCRKARIAMYNMLPIEYQ